MYGTAWKEDETRRLVGLALASGFRAIDTANQRKHYFEAAVGEALAESPVAREDVWLQTKFTHIDSQDERLPYDARAPIAEQVAQSFQSSLEHLRTGKIDSYLLHGPSTRQGLARADLDAWGAMEAIQKSGRVTAIGVSNVTRAQLALLIEKATVKPSFVQNRCYASTGWDREVRAICMDYGITYQGFSLLTANRKELKNRAIVALAARRGITVAQLVFRFALDVGMAPLTGTTSEAHMKEDLAVVEPLGPEELRLFTT